MNDLKLTILKHFTHVKMCAEHLNVEPATVKHWIDNAPRNLLKHLPEISTATDMSYDEIVRLVLQRETEIGKTE
jgi:hypothetical protein